jgi:hypothetical protein
MNKAMTRAWAAALGGTTALGAVAGMAHGTSGMLSGALAVPAVVGGVTVLTLPALYIGSAFTGGAPAAAELLASAGRALRDLGVVALGLIPALIFLAATSEDPLASAWIGSGVLGLAALFGVRSLHQALGTGRRLEARLLFLAWATLTVGLGARLLSL